MTREFFTQPGMSVKYFTVRTASVAETFSCEREKPAVAWNMSMRKDRTYLMTSRTSRTVFGGRFAPCGIGAPKGDVRPNGVLQT